MVDDIRFEKYFGYMIKTNRKSSIFQIMTASKAVVEYLFHNHEFCDKKGCKSFKQKQKGKGKELSQSYYRSKINDAKLYEQIWNAYKPFTTRERLQESLYLFDTQQNEAMNVSIPKYALKTKRYGMTISLTNRVLISVGISNISAVTYWEQVYFSLDLSMATETTSSLKSQDTFRFYKKNMQLEQTSKVRERRIITVK